MIEDENRTLEEQLLRLRAATGERVDTFDAAHLLATLWKWRVLIAAGMLFFVAASYALLRATPPDFQAQKVLVIDQPAIVATGNEGREASAKILSLIPTFARLATTDEVLAGVRRSVGTAASIDQLRARVTAQPIVNELALRITARDARATVSTRLAEATAKAFATSLDSYQAENGVPAARGVCAQLPPASQASVVHERPSSTHGVPETTAVCAHVPAPSHASVVQAFWSSKQLVPGPSAGWVHVPVALHTSSVHGFASVVQLLPLTRR